MLVTTIQLLASRSLLARTRSLYSRKSGVYKSTCLKCPDLYRGRKEPGSSLTIPSRGRRNPLMQSSILFWGISSMSGALSWSMLRVQIHRFYRRKTPTDFGESTQFGVADSTRSSIWCGNRVKTVLRTFSTKILLSCD